MKGHESTRSHLQIVFWSAKGPKSLVWRLVTSGTHCRLTFATLTVCPTERTLFYSTIIRDEPNPCDHSAKGVQGGKNEFDLVFG